MVRTVSFLSPTCLEDILQLSLWQMEYQGIYIGITMDGAHFLCKKGLRYF